MGEMINVRIPSNDFTILADTEGVIISFPKPLAIHLFESDLKTDDSKKVHKYVEKTHTDVPPAESPKVKHGGKKVAEGRYRLGGDVLSAVEVYRQNTRISMAKIKNLVSEKTGVKLSTLSAYFERGICCADDFVKALGDTIGYEIVPKLMDGETKWSLGSGLNAYEEEHKAEESSAELESTAEVKTDLQERIQEATKPRSLPDRATLSTGIRTLIEDYLHLRNITMALLCHELAVRIGVSKTAVQLMLNGQTETIEKLIPYIKEIVKIDIVRIEDDGKAFWEGV